MSRLTAIVIDVLISLVEALDVTVSVLLAYAGALALVLSFASSILHTTRRTSPLDQIGNISTSSSKATSVPPRPK